MTQTQDFMPNQAATGADLRNIEQFLYREAYLLDHNRLEEWFALFTTDATYWIPL